MRHFFNNARIAWYELAAHYSTNMQMLTGKGL